MVPRRGKELNIEAAIDVTDKCSDSFAEVFLGDGEYSLISMFETTAGEEVIGQIDMMNPDSVSLLINEVYEKHYENLKEYFGNTLVGFFADLTVSSVVLI